jgi:hypothetical protein
MSFYIAFFEKDQPRLDNLGVIGYYVLSIHYFRTKKMDSKYIEPIFSGLPE